jgi:hypothetical protein
MAKFLSDRQRTLSVGIANYTEGSSVLDVTGDIGVSGIVTAKTGAAVTYYGDGSNLTGIAVTSLQFNDSSISIATTDGSIIFKSNNVIVASISSETASWRVPFNLNNNRITNLAAPSSLSDATNKDYVDNQVAGDFPTGDYGDLFSGNDAFGQVVTNFVAFDCLTTPSGSLETADLGALT